MADPEGSKYFNDIKAFAASEGADVNWFCQLVQRRNCPIKREDKAEFLEMAGVTEPGLSRMIRAAYHLLDLRTFFTAGGRKHAHPKLG